MRVAAHAKINLTLEVLGVRPDGYHDLRSIVLPIPLHDDVELSLADTLTLTCVNAPAELQALPPEKNLAYRAARALQRATGCTQGAAITLTKRIPAGAGLGGGSADAAAVLNGLNELWQLGLDKSRLAEIGASVGSDVPALVWNEPVLMEGRGERVTPLRLLPITPCTPLTHQAPSIQHPAPSIQHQAPSTFPLPHPLPDLNRLVLRTPPVFVSTPKVFAEFRETDRGLGANDLQPAACRLHPEIAAALAALAAEGCEGVQMSGSGSSVFGWRRASH